MYVYTSEDGIHFSEGREVFTRANCGVKYNTLTDKFMMAYEYTTGNLSRVYYMESDDGYKFTYSNFIEAANNEDILSTGAGFVRCYPDFVHDGTGCINDYTFYVAYMEGTMADAGNDWRQYANTWDIHISAVNLAFCENRTQVLPDGHVYTEDTIQPYRARPYRIRGADRRHTEADGGAADRRAGNGIRGRGGECRGAQCFGLQGRAQQHDGNLPRPPIRKRRFMCSST